jgi:outer membrane protein OmpA-like peptidoglycan-associated protein
MEIPLPCPRRVPSVLGFASLALASFLASASQAQQVTTPDGAVTIDYGALDALGASQAQANATSPSAADQASEGPSYGFPQASSRPQPVAAQTGQLPAGAQTEKLLNPPSQNPVSGLTVPLPAGATLSPPSTASAAPMESKPSSTTQSGVEASGVPAPAVVPPAPEANSPPAGAPELGTSLEPSPPSFDAGTASENPSGSSGSAATGISPPPPGASGPPPSAGVGIAPPPPEPSSGGTTASEQSPPAGAPPTAAPSSGEGSSDQTAGSGAASGAPSTQTAAVPPAESTEGQLRIVFAPDSSNIPDKMKVELDALAQKLNADENLRIQLLAYASGTADQASQSRRISLSRALAVRSYLIKQGVRSTRMDVRALGNNVKDGPQDRVDIVSRAQ